MKNILYILLLFPTVVQAQFIHISTPVIAICKSSTAIFTATDSGITTPHYSWKLNGTNTGTDSATYTTNSLNNGDSITSVLTDSTGDSIFATSNLIVISVDTPLNAGTITGYDTVCVNATTTLTESVPGGIWSENTGAASIDSGIVTGIHGEGEGFPAFDSVFYTVSNSCGSAVASVQIVVKPLPDASFILTFFGDVYPVTSLCYNQTLEVNHGDGVDGTLISKHGHAYYDFMGSLSAYSAGFDTLISISTNSCGTDTFTLPIVVYGPPTSGSIIAPKTEICIGDTIILSDTGANSTIGVGWGISNNIAGFYSDQGKAFGLTAGIDTITITNWFCGEASTSITITVNPTPQLNGTNHLCAGSRLQLPDSLQNTVWSSSAPSTATIDPGGLLHCIAEGTTLISARIGACTAAQEITVTAPPAPISGMDIVCAGTTTTLSDTGHGTWSTPDTGIAAIDSSSGILSGISNGSATISFTNDLGCEVTKHVAVVNCDKEISIFPNPVQNELIVQADYRLYNYCVVANCLGQIISRQTIDQPITEINTQYLVPGIYIIYLGGVKPTYHSKFVKE